MQIFRYDRERRSSAKDLMFIAALLLFMELIFFAWRKGMSVLLEVTVLCAAVVCILLFCFGLKSFLSAAGEIAVDRDCIIFRRKKSEIHLRFEAICSVVLKGRIFPYVELHDGNSKMRIYKTLLDYPRLWGVLREYTPISDMGSSDRDFRFFRLESPHTTLAAAIIPAIMLFGLSRNELWQFAVWFVFTAIPLGIVAANIAGGFHRLNCRRVGVSYRTAFNKWSVRAEDMERIVFRQIRKSIITGYNRIKQPLHKRPAPPVGYGLLLDICTKDGIVYSLNDCMTYFPLEILAEHLAQRYQVPVEYRGIELQ